MDLSESVPLNLKRKSEDTPDNNNKHPRTESPFSGDPIKPEPQFNYDNSEGVNNNCKTLPNNNETESDKPNVKYCDEADHGGGTPSDNRMVQMRDEMYEKYQPWVMKTYGEQTKTKTITMRKYDRIVRTLRGQIPNTAENSKFRFWVRTKGFRLCTSSEFVESGDQQLLVASSKGNGDEVYKWVAVVEKFFDIIYGVHVELEGRAGRHAGQKRTYKAITESYAFLPREAVTKFLLGCVECQKRSDVEVPLPLEPKLKPPDQPATPKRQHQLQHVHYADDKTETAHARDSDDDRHEATTHTYDRELQTRATRDENYVLTESSQEHYLRTVTAETVTEPLDVRGPHHYPDVQYQTFDSNILLHRLTESHRLLNTPINLTYKQNSVPLNIPKVSSIIENKTVEEGIAKINLSGILGKDSEQSRKNKSKLSTSTPVSSSDRKQSSSGSETTISKSSDGPSSLDISPIDNEFENFQRPFPKKLFTINPTTLETVQIPLKITEFGISVKKRKFYLNTNGKRPDSEQSTAEPQCDQPIMSTYLKHMRSLGYSDEDALKLDVKEVRSTPEPEGNEEHYQGRNGDGRLPCGEMSPSEDVSGLWQYHSALGVKKATPPTPRELSSPVTIQETGSVHDETSSSGNKDDDDDDDEEIDDLKTLPHDPERLKAFNMFVRLFVDENLDRIVPISKQPKEKIQAIIDSCTRQFPEFAERARKRIRTYLKSCRRNKRTRDSNWPDSARPTPAHLTSVQAEQILAQACENESHNAKRMRIGLEPISQPMPVIPGSEPVNTRPVDTFSSTTVTPSSGSTTDSSKQHLIHLNNNKPESPNLAKATEASNVSLSSLSGSPLNGATGSTVQPNLYRANFNQSFQRTGPAPHPYPGSALFPAPPFGSASMMPNGPTDLSMKASSKPLLSHKLNPTEIAAVRQLITGYRESAAFLLRSADELEHLLLQQP